MSLLPTARLVRDRGSHHVASGAPASPVIALAPRTLPPGLAARVLLGGSIQWWAWLVVWFTFMFTVDPDPAAGPGLVIAAPLAGIYLLRRRWRLLRVFRFGRETRGRRLWESEGDMPIEGVTAVEVAFEYQDDTGRTWKTRVWTRKPEQLRDEPTERMLYDPDQPRHAILLDALPYKLSLTPDGKLEVPSGIGSLASYLVGPTLAVGICLVAAAFAILLAVT